MLPFANPFKFFLCNSIVSVLGALILNFFRYVSYIYRNLFNSESNSIDYGANDMDVGSVLAIHGNKTILETPTEPVSVLPSSNSSKFQLKPTSQIHEFMEESQTTSCFVQQLFCDQTPCFDDGSIEQEQEQEQEHKSSVSNAESLAVNDWNDEENQESLEESKETELDEIEHHDLINQLKIELRHSRTGRLPTVLEEETEPEPEPESMRPIALKPLKNGGNFEQKEHFKEIHGLYKTYTDKMRKLDIFNTQTNYAIGFVKLKEPVFPNDARKSSLKSLFSDMLRPGRADKGCLKLIKDIKRDMEMVYVGHLCLSWELLQWQHRKAKQLQQNDSQFSQVVNEFQLFCILIQRFIEDEPFNGPRIENYAKNRRLVRNLLQVPAIREDCVNNKNLSTISTADLVSIIEDSIRVFRELLQTDKDIGNSAIKFMFPQEHVHRIDTQNPFDAELMMIQKEKRLKDMMRSGNCIVKKLQRMSEEGIARDELLIAEVELRLISRVVSMSRLTENQLIWCHKKLHQVKFVHGKVALEPSFLLFPC
ncbi:uncharacterized protein LOC111787869 isoform X2 [Cucurbita pepo subsp. pepo]|uniref:uncharacterized protein LOC111787869 isoform X2 n=1 Tax=Cucurbita pepo subsp. pepo TaxID=3664 RepID=UPI000C9D51DD|nr:uncharacterized protein LOC111787869 isoform X2 [Cucurbita pepo subsp. pepo]